MDCGVYLVKETSYSFQGRPSTITVSRNGHSSLLLWTHISSHSYEDQISTLLGCFGMLEYALGRFEELQKKLGVDLCVVNTAPSLSIIFRQPKRKSILTKYAFMLIELCIDSEKRPLVQMFAMKHVTTDLIDALRGFQKFSVFPVFWYCRIGYSVLTTKIAFFFIIR